MTSKSVNNNVEANKQKNRYWSDRKSTQNSAKHSSPAIDKNQSDNNPPKLSVPVKFVPYSSVLTSIKVPEKSFEEIVEPEIKVENENEKTSKFLNPLSKNGLEKMKKLKKLKNAKVSKQQQKKETNVSSDSDDVIALEFEPPAPILIDSSDESVMSKKELLQSTKSGKLQTVNRCISPSSNSMMSDDFIINQDKNRLNESFSFDMAEPDLFPRTAESAKNPTENIIFDKSLKDLQLEKLSSIESSSGNEKSKKVDQTSKSCDNDSIYRSKTRKSSDSLNRRRSTSYKPSDSSSSENETTPSIKKQKVPKRRRKSNAAGKSKSESEVEVEPKHKLFRSTPKVTSKNLKSIQNFISETYVEEEFGNMLSTILQNDSIEQDENPSETCEKDSVISLDVSQTLGSESEKAESSQKDQKDPVTIIDVDEISNDCVIIEKPIETITIDNDYPMFTENSCDEVPRPKQTECSNTDLILNVQRQQFEPHEYIRDYDKAKGSLGTFHVENEGPEDPEIGWNEEMKRFYNESWGGENFDTNDEISLLPRKLLKLVLIFSWLLILF